MKEILKEGLKHSLNAICTLLFSKKFQENYMIKQIEKDESKIKINNKHVLKRETKP